jgi:hypothetical protein
VQTERKGVMGIRTMSALLEQRRSRTSAGALLELSAMANEKLLLEREVARASRRNTEIQRRLKEIAAKEERLMKIVRGAKFAPVEGCPARPALPAEPVTTVEPPPSSRFKVSEFSY